MEAITQIDYKYQDYLNEWQSQPREGEPLTPAEFEDTLARFMGYSQKIGTAYRYGEKRAGDSLREQRRPLKLALLL